MKIVGIIVMSIAIYGILLPNLISAKNDLLVLLGIVVGIGYTWAVVGMTYDNLKEKDKEES